MARHLTLLATSRLSQAFCESTKRAYAALFRVFLAFVTFMSWELNQVNVFNLLCFLECLHFNGVKVSQMANYLSAIKSTFIIYGLDVSCFTDQRLKLYQRAVQIHAPLAVKLNKIIDIALLKQIVHQCDLTYMGQIFKAVYLLSFFSFLRLSNLVPHCVGAFSPLRHLARGDLIFKPEKVIIMIKWSKTMQKSNQLKLISIPRLAKSPICPVRALSNALALTPRGSNLPLFQVKSNTDWIPLTDTKVRRHLSLVLSNLGLSGAGFTFHTFRRSGATFAFNNNVQIQNIQKHGTWTSDCVWRYITDSTDAGDQVAKMFREKLSVS